LFFVWHEFSLLSVCRHKESTTQNLLQSDYKISGHFAFKDQPVSACDQGRVDVVIILRASEDHYLECVLQFSHLPDNLDAIEPWHVNVHYDRVGIVRHRSADRCESVGDGADHFKFFFQNFLDSPGHEFIVITDEYAGLAEAGYKHFKILHLRPS
jgi:hypothetical protein